MMVDYFRAIVELGEEAPVGGSWLDVLAAKAIAVNGLAEAQGPERQYLEAIVQMARNCQDVPGTLREMAAVARDALEMLEEQQRN